jgi:hypothetical protein
MKYYPDIKFDQRLCPYALTESETPMLNLNESQREFLFSHDVPLDLIFDATGMANDTYLNVMRCDDKILAFGVSPCAQGHTMRVSSGCPQCNEKYIEFAMRYKRANYVYIAGSRMQQKIKIGVVTGANDLQRRIEMLNTNFYADAWDWQLLCHMHAGKYATIIESNTHFTLLKWAETSDCIDSCEELVSREIFSCRYIDAKMALLCNDHLFRTGKFVELPDALDY